MRVVPLEERTGMTTSRRKADLRSKRSQEKLSDALLVLLKKKKIDKISVKEIAASCGFDDTSYFCKVFRKFHGLSPARFRSPTFFSQ